MPITCVGKAGLTPLRDEASPLSRSGTQIKKKNLFAGLYFSYLPTSGAAPWSFLAQQKGMVRLSTLYSMAGFLGYPLYYTLP